MGKANLSRKVRRDWASRVTILTNLGPVQTSNFTCAETNANEQKLLFLLSLNRA